MYIENKKGSANMTVKKMYKTLHKAFPKANIWVTNGFDIYWLSIPSIWMTLYGKCQVTSLEMDAGIHENPMYVLRVD